MTSLNWSGGRFIVQDAEPEHILTPEDFTEEQTMLAETVRAFVDRDIKPRDAEIEKLDYELTVQLMRKAGEIGLLGADIPEAYGGLGLDQRFEDIFFEEAEPYRLPWHFGNAFNVVVPTLLAHASEELKTRYLPAMLRGEHLWCQLLSEPSGGSDLAGLQMRAQPRGDGWVLNGSKVWTTGGLDCDLGLCLVGPFEDPLTAERTPMVLALYVEPAVRHRGLARALVDEARAVLAERGFHRLAARAGHNDDALVSMGERWGYVRQWELMLLE